jgi:hypothetical protein
VSQPCEKRCEVKQPAELDSELNEFWVGNPFEIYTSQNLSSYERNRMFLNTGTGKFVDISFPSGLDTDSDGRASIPIDIDNDGMLDLVLRQAGGGALVVLKNQFPLANYLKVSLRGTQSNRQGIGSRLTATVSGRRIVREVYPVNTYRSQRPLVAHFGLGQADATVELTILWPSGTQQTISGIKANQHILVTEGKAEWTEIVAGETIEDEFPLE